MFANCPNLTSLDLSSFNTKGVEYVDNIFKNCSNLTTIYASENFAFGSGLKMVQICSLVVISSKVL